MYNHRQDKSLRRVMEMEIDVLVGMLEIQLVQPAGSCKLSPPPLPTRTPLFRPLFHIPLLHLPNNLPPRGISESRFLLLITHGPQKRSSCLEKWDRGRAGGSTAVEELGWETQPD